MTLTEYARANTASNQDWLRASKDLLVSVYHSGISRTETTDQFMKVEFGGQEAAELLTSWEYFGALRNRISARHPE